jgi:hypothetical protein
VSIVAADADAPCHADRPSVVLSVHTDNTRLPNVAESGPFASIQFVDGAPQPTLDLHYDNLLRLGLAAVVVSGTHESQWPRSMRERVLARMIGRVLAHEVGHWILRSRVHSRTGLMRPMQGVAELANRDGAGFRLDPNDVVRLRERLGYVVPIRDRW